jgi:hypothetical protein
MEIISKEEFVKCMNKLEEHEEFTDKMNDFFKPYIDDFIYADYRLYDVIINLLEFMFNDKYYINYFTRELNFGKNDKQDEVKISNASELYDLLVSKLDDLK